MSRDTFYRYKDAVAKKKNDDQTCGEIDTTPPGYQGSQDTFYVGTLKGVGRVYQQTYIDTYSKVALAKFYTTKTPITAADMLNDKVLPFMEEHQLTDLGPQLLDLALLALRGTLLPFIEHARHALDRLALPIGNHVRTDAVLFRQFRHRQLALDRLQRHARLELNRNRSPFALHGLFLSSDQSTLTTCPNFGDQLTSQLWQLGQLKDVPMRGWFRCICL